VKGCATIPQSTLSMRTIAHAVAQRPWTCLFDADHNQLRIAPDPLQAVFFMAFQESRVGSRQTPAAIQGG